MNILNIKLEPTSLIQTDGGDDGERVQEGGGEAPLPRGARAVPAAPHRLHHLALVALELHADTANLIQLS